MLTRRSIFWAGAGAVALAGVARFPLASSARATGNFPLTHTDAEWKKLLTSDQYDVLRREGTEAPFSSPLNHQKGTGIFHCAGCDQAAFSSKTKFDSGTGWPSFWAPLDKAVATNKDTSFGMVRNEVHCTNCGGHLGHVFDDGPKPTGLRYCMNGVALTFQPGSA